MRFGCHAIRIITGVAERGYGSDASCGTDNNVGDLVCADTKEDEATQWNVRYAMQVEDANVYFGSSTVCASKRLMVSFCSRLNVWRSGV